jgi:cell division transport system permease protein
MNYRFSYFSSFFGVYLVLLAFALLELVLFNAHKLSNYYKEKVRMSIFLEPNTKENEISFIQKKMAILPQVKSVSYISPERAIEIFAEKYGEDLAGFEEQVLPASLEVQFNANDLKKDLLQHLSDKLLVNKAVQEVRFEQKTVEKLEQNMSHIKLYLLGIFCLLLFIALALIYNTVHLSIFAKRLLIRTMLLVGATERFIKAPFVTRFTFIGFTGAVLSFLTLVLMIYLLSQKYLVFHHLLDTKILSYILLSTLPLGTLMCYFSAHWALHKNLRMHADKIY